MRYSVLLVEDEEALHMTVGDRLRKEGYAVENAADGQEGFKKATQLPFDLIILDVMLPKKSGFAVCQEIRKAGLITPILMLTARREESDKVVGLESGADDYLTKPFGVRELVARARALLRRPRLPVADAAEVAPTRSGDVFSIRGIAIDVPRRRVTVDDGDVELTDQEFRLLHLLATHAGIVFSREALLAKIWRGDTFVTVRSVDTLVKRLRRRIEPDPALPRFLITVWGVGYKFADV